MTEHGIIFSAPMVRAILNGRKTVERRISREWVKRKAGDRLWVRETWVPLHRDNCEPFDRSVKIEPSWRFKVWYAADSTGMADGACMQNKRPSIHMPRRASRITLELTEDARLEPLQSITEEDAIAEGILLLGNMKDGDGYGAEDGQRMLFDSAVEAYGSLWDSLHGKTHPWSSNPSVVRLAFRRVG